MSTNELICNFTMFLTLSRAFTGEKYKKSFLTIYPQESGSGASWASSDEDLPK